MIDVIKGGNRNISGSGIRYGHGISDSSGIRYGHGINESYGISSSYGIYYGHGINESYGINDGYNICGGYGINTGYGIHDSSGICNGYSIRCGHGIRFGYGICDGCGIYYSKYCRDCEGISRCILCYQTSGKLMIFNKPVTEDRFHEVFDELDWYPDFTNANELKAKYGNGEWEATPAYAITERTAKEAYAEMPKKLIKYIKAMPEYDAKIFKAIMGLK